jgi:hypothetical protein
MDVGSENPQAMQDALDQLAQELAGSKFRAALKEDPEAATTAAGINPDNLPDGLLGALGLMSDEELQIVSRVQQSFRGSFRDPISVAILF